MVYDASLLEGEPAPDGVGGSGGAAGSTGGASAAGGETSGSGGEPATGGAGPTGGASAGGGASGGASTGGAAGAGGGATGGAGATEILIDDLEHGDEAYLNIPFVGNWRLADDGTSAGVWTSPVAPKSNSTPFSTSDRGGGNLAVHAKADGYTNWGVDLYVSLQETQAEGNKPIDLSQYGGIFFWAKADSATKKIKVSVEDQTSHADYAHIGMEKTVTGTWARYDVSFAELEFGKSRTIERDKIYAIHFSVNSSAVDFWIDDVGLYQ